MAAGDAVQADGSGASGLLNCCRGGGLVNAADPDFRLLVRGALETGARFGELAAARVRDYRERKATRHKVEVRPRPQCGAVGCRYEFFESVTVGRPR